jgi:hypothetical protein
MTFTFPQGPGREFARWLMDLTPPEAEVVPIMGPIGVDGRWPTECLRPFGAPLITEFADPPLPRRRDARRIAVAERMPAPHARQPGRQAPRSGIPMWTMNTAFVTDIYGLNSLEAMRALELRDYSTVDAEGGSRSARRYAEQGRRALSKIGAWPWCLTPDGRLPERWYRDSSYAYVLARWHYQQSLAVLAAAFHAVECAAGGREKHMSHAPRIGLAQSTWRPTRNAWALGNRSGSSDVRRREARPGQRPNPNRPGP